MLVCVDCGRGYDAWPDLRYHQLHGACDTPTLAGGSEGVVWVDSEGMARVVHEAARALQVEAGDPVVNPPWDEAPEWLRASVRDGVMQALDGASAQDLHEHWCGYRWAAGWSYGPQKDPDAKTHPLLRPWEHLEAEQRYRAEVFVSIVGTLR